jgi:hypothetical protein
MPFKSALFHLTLQYLLFRGGIGIDQTSGFFFMEKVEMLVGRLLGWVLWPLLFIW